MCIFVQMKIMKPIVLFLLFICLSPEIMSQIQQPAAPKQPKELVTLKHKRIDNYYWMNQRDSADVLQYIEEENKYCEAYFEPMNPLVNELMKEFEQRIDPNEESSPFYYNKRLYQENSRGRKEVAIC